MNRQFLDSWEYFRRRNLVWIEMDEDKAWDWTHYIDVEILLERENHLNHLIIHDDKDQFATFVKNQLEERLEGSEDFETSAVWLSKLLVTACHFCAIDCAKILLEGELGVAVDTNYVGKVGMSPLHHAAVSGCFRLTELLLRHGARTDFRFDITLIRCYDSHRIVHGSKLPLEVALLMYSEDICLCDWSPEESISKLLFLLCLPEKREPLDALRLLVLNTKEVREIIYRCALEGKIVELAVLLLVAPEKIMAPIMFQCNFSSDINGKLTIREYILLEYLALVDKELKLPTRSFQSATRLRNKQEVLKYELSLLHVFENVGDGFDTYIRSEQTNVTKLKVAKEVVMLLQKAGFVCECLEIDLDIVKSILCDCTRCQSMPWDLFNLSRNLRGVNFGMMKHLNKPRRNYNTKIREKSR